ncbi:MAG: hypothetical protein K5979_09270 [Ruminococcus sp.]|nr:hypothetical protein [Ruminococcus sp.]
MTDITPILFRYRHRHRYNHKTAAGSTMFWIGAVVFLIFNCMSKYGGERLKNNRVVGIMALIGLGLILISYPVDMILA